MNEEGRDTIPQTLFSSGKCIFEHACHTGQRNIWKIPEARNTSSFLLRPWRQRRLLNDQSDF
ncbi:hypothetical protein MtrunA17_Chr2g0324211 [Medicago truncatula]|uniref:Uncharacterized protein n=1 Tax=Medicago truncatula TaxID=3880 RepID=A0A396JHC7_MEDTR|nr:hypothetical protein MtrunA17_Chr2g0324211 [Medicago truncatula]